MSGKVKLNERLSLSYQPSLFSNTSPTDSRPSSRRASSQAITKSTTHLAVDSSLVAHSYHHTRKPTPKQG